MLIKQEDNTKSSQFDKKTTFRFSKMSFMALPQYQNELMTGQPSSSRNNTKSRDTKRSKANDDQLNERFGLNSNYEEKNKKKATVTIL